MKIFGHEYGLLYTVGAQEEIAALKDLKNLDTSKIAGRIPVILSDWNEKAESLRAKQEGREYEPHPLTWETVRHLTPAEFDELLLECDRVRKRDTTRTVEADSAETEKKTDAAAGS